MTFEHPTVREHGHDNSKGPTLLSGIGGLLLQRPRWRQALKPRGVTYRKHKNPSGPCARCSCVCNASWMRATAYLPNGGHRAEYRVANALTALFFARGQNAAFVTESFKNACTPSTCRGKFRRRHADEFIHVHTTPGRDQSATVTSSQLAET